MPDENDPHIARRVWLDHAPAPRARPRGLKWDVFISYRSVNRPWALALYDTLRETGYDIFLDQYELAAGVELEEELIKHLDASASGVLVWTNAASESRWVRAELKRMKALRERRPDFHYVIVKLDDVELPFLDQESLYVDFRNHPDGPRGGELLRLMYGLRGEPLTRPALQAVHALDTDAKALLGEVRAARERGDISALVALAASDRPALHATSMPLAAIAEALVQTSATADALRVLEVARKRFPAAIRPRQIAALAYRREKQVTQAQEIMSLLYEEGHRDPETLGIYAATWAKRYEQSRDVLHLKRSQAYYADAFRLAPTDSYVGINAASKLALLGDLERARSVAAQVVPLVDDADDGTDYWKTVTKAEVRLLLGDLTGSRDLFEIAITRHSERRGDIGSTKGQATLLCGALGLSADESARVLMAFPADIPPA